MTDGMAVELAVDDPGGCPVAAASDDTGAAASEVARAGPPDEEGRIVEEFSLPSSAAPADLDMAAVATRGSRDVYRFRRDPEGPCVCEAVERATGPVSEIRAEDGTLYVSVYATDVADVRTVVEDLRGQFGGVRVRQLAQAGWADGDPVVVDRARLTDRQREVLETAHEMGYFDHPKGANANEVADALEVSSSTVREHLAAAQSKLLDAVLEA